MASVTMPAGMPAVPVDTTGTSITEEFVHPALGATNDCGVTLCKAACCALAHDCQVASDEPATGNAGTDTVVVSDVEADAMPVCGRNTNPIIIIAAGIVTFRFNLFFSTLILAAHFIFFFAHATVACTPSPIND